jgi:hypothetical protein
MKVVQFITKVFLISTLISASAFADGFVNEWFRAVEAEQQIEVLSQQVIDFQKYSGDPMEAVEYEPTGERFADVQAIQRALPVKQQQLSQLKQQYARYVGDSM